MTPTVLVVLVLAAAALALLGGWLVPTWRRWRGARVINCPETNDPETVRIDAKHAALTSVGAVPELRLESCSRWPERQDCGQDCLKQIENSRDGCLVKSMVAEWYVGKSCVFCGKPIVFSGFADHAAALVAPDGSTVLWKDLRPESLPAIFRTHQAACWNCHVAESVVRNHPEVVTVRPERDQLIH